MSPLLSILRTAHSCRTHHHFALDALPLVQTDAGRRLVTLLLRHHDRYLTGAHEPDERFRDFQNHVIHVTDGYWGGAPRVAHRWYDRMQRYLRTNRVADAAHAAGVLSHYFTDPLQPLHTQQCDRERILHRPIEWSINQSYDLIFRCWKEDDMRVVFQLSDSPGWLGEAMLHSARFANRKYGQLLDDYDLAQGVNDPPAGLSIDLIASLAELVGLAVTGWARVLERAAADAESTRQASLPDPVLLIPTVLAALRVPMRLLNRHMEYREEQLAVAALVDEFCRTGVLQEHLPAEVDIVHRVVKVYEEEKRWNHQLQHRLASQRTVVDVKAAETSSAELGPMPATIPFAPRRTIGESRSPGSLADADPLTEAPSIGPRTAARFAAIGIHTIGQFLAASAQQTASQLGAYWITGNAVSQWQAQATLMCDVPGLKCREAQLLAGVDYDTAEKVAVGDPAVLHRQVSEFAATTRGRRYLCGAAPPSPAEVKTWIAAAAITQLPVRRSA